MKNSTKNFTLYNGVTIPCIGFGTYKAATGDSADIIATAIEAGYRYFDTASFYGTEIYLAEAIKKCPLAREDFFITSKVWKDEMGYDNTKEAFKRIGKHRARCRSQNRCRRQQCKYFFKVVFHTFTSKFFKI